MQHAPVNDKKTKPEASRSEVEQEPQRLKSLSGWGDRSAQGQNSRLVNMQQGYGNQAALRMLQGEKRRSRQSQPLQQQENLAALQKAYGNQAVLRMKGRSPAISSVQGGVLQRKCACGNTAGASGSCAECQSKQEGILQTKLQIGEPGDRYEQEADRVAKEVMRMPDPSLQRQVEPEEDMIQRKAVPKPNLLNSDQTLAEVPAIVHEVVNSSGQPLYPETRTFMESRFKHDFSQVRVHTDARAAESAQAVEAIAYTVGQSVIFGVGQYNPKTIAGRELIAHELTHVLQQSSDVYHPGKVTRPTGSKIIQRQAIPIPAPILIPIGAVLLILAVLALVAVGVNAAYSLLMSKLQEMINAIETVSDSIEEYLRNNPRDLMRCSSEVIAFREAKQAIIEALRNPAKSGPIIIIRRLEAFHTAANSLASCLGLPPIF